MGAFVDQHCIYFPSSDTNTSKRNIDIAGNTANITTNTTDIADSFFLLSRTIGANTTNITTNTTDIATNTADIATSVTDIATNAADIAAETTRASAAESTNAANIAAETTRASAAESTNAANIATNTADIATKISITDIVNDLITGGATVPLSAEQGKVLKDLVDTKAAENSAITAATKTKITYDAKGLVTGGADATTADIAASADRNYVTDAEAVVIGNTSGTNSGDQIAATITSSATANISATNVNDALAELDTEKLALAGGSMTGSINMGSNNISNIGNATISGTLDVTGDTSISTLNSSGATSLATSSGVVNIASTGVMTTVKGILNVDEAVTLDTTLDVTGDTSVSTFDSSGATSLATSGGVVNIASTGVMTTVKGTLNVDQAVTLDTTIDVTGITNLNSTTTSTNSTTGALVVDGGVGIAENLNVGGAIDVTDAATTRNNLGVYSGILTWSASTGPGASTETFLSIPGVNTSSVIIVTKNGGDSTIGFIESAICSTNGTITIKTTTSLTVGTKISYFIIN